MSQQSGSDTAAAAVSNVIGSGCRNEATRLNGQGGLAHTAVAQHHQLVQGHFARHVC